MSLSKRKLLASFLLIFVMSLLGFFSFQQLKIVIAKEKWIDVPFYLATPSASGKTFNDSLKIIFKTQILPESSPKKSGSEPILKRQSFTFEFEVSDLQKIDFLKFDISYPESFILNLNGKQIGTAPNLNITENPVSYTIIADHTPNSSHPESFIFSATNLKEGKNLVTLTLCSLSPEPANTLPLKKIEVYKNGYFWVGWNGLKKQNIPEAYPSDLPVFQINTLGNVIEDDEKVNAQLIIENNLKNKIQNIKIEYHGKSSQWHSQLSKSYSFNTYNTNWKKSNVSILQLAAGSEWVLYAPYIDKSLIRNALTYTLATNLTNKSPELKFCNVYVNKVYMGIYMLVQKPHIENAESFKNNLNSPPLLFEIDRPDPKYYGWNLHDNATGFTHINVLYPKPKDLDTTLSGPYIKSTVNLLDQAFLSKPLNHKNMDSLIDIESLIHFMLLNELSKNPDAYGLSVLFSKSPDQPVHMGPIWDFDLAYGNLGDESWSESKSWCMELPAGTQFQRIEWIPSLLQDSIYFQLVKEKWNTLRKQSLSDQAIFHTIDLLVQQIRTSENYYHQTIPILDKWVWPNAYVGGNYEKEIYYLKCWIIKRLIWMDHQLNQNSPALNITVSKN